MPKRSHRALFAAMLTFSGGLIAGFTSLGPAHAQFYGPSYYGPSPYPFFDNFFPFQRPRIRPRVRRFSPSYVRPSYERRPVVRRVHPQPTLPATAPAPRKLEQPPTRIGLVIGDTMAEWLAYGLEEAFAETPEIGVVRKVKGSAGLAGKCKGELQAWLQDSLAAEKAEKLAFVAIMIGTADRRSIRNCPARAEGTDSKAESGAQSFPFHSDEWSALYAARVGEVVSALKSKGVPVFWVGLPPMRNVRDADIEVLNDIYEARAEKAGAKFVNVWDSFVDESGDYAVRGPDVNGQTRRLRASDGTYFTKAGARKLAWHLEKEIKPIMAARPQVATPAPEPSAGPSADKRASRPIAGPVVPLDTFATPKKPEQLVGGGAGNSSPGPVAGRTPHSREQKAPADIRRADDFTWPRRQAQSSDTETQLEGAPQQSPPPDREGPSARD
jgi:uncharacterized protein